MELNFHIDENCWILNLNQTIKSTLIAFSVFLVNILSILFFWARKHTVKIYFHRELPNFFVYSRFELVLMIQCYFFAVPTTMLCTSLNIHFFVWKDKNPVNPRLHDSTSTDCAQIDNLILYFIEISIVFQLCLTTHSVLNLNLLYSEISDINQI